MAGLGWKKFVRGTLSSAEVNGYLMDQAVMKFASAAARLTALAAPSRGMMSARDDAAIAPILEMFTGSAWRKVAEPPTILRSNPAISTADLTVGQTRGLHNAVTYGQPFGAGVPFFGLVWSRCLVTLQGNSQARLGAVGDPASFSGDVQQNTSGLAELRHLNAIDVFSTATADTYTYQPILKAEAGTCTPINDVKFSFSILAAWRGV